MRKSNITSIDLLSITLKGLTVFLACDGPATFPPTGVTKLLIRKAVDRDKLARLVELLTAKTINYQRGSSLSSRT